MLGLLELPEDLSKCGRIEGQACELPCLPVLLIVASLLRNQPLVDLLLLLKPLLLALHLRLQVLNFRLLLFVLAVDKVKLLLHTLLLELVLGMQLFDLFKLLLNHCVVGRLHLEDVLLHVMELSLVPLFNLLPD